MSLVWNYAENPIANLLLAHGAGAGLDSDFMVEIAELLAARGVNVARFDFEYMQQAKALNKRRPPDRAPKLLDCFLENIHRVNSDLPLFIAGKSMGGRMATLLAAQNEVDVYGVIALGYPFHPPGKPEKLRTEHFGDVTVPFLIVQGERDTFGTKDEVLGLPIPQTIKFEWLQDGDHSFKPRKSSGYSESGHRVTAANAISDFINRVLL
ncbi:alpha/beta family hydrolase [Pseudoalteromonas xiamenensis]|uniref:alpha/beta family hydrolase n=1 Tax=Pseudoalteromonas xiamenensis TaxID=882626 RepID=UPI0035ED843A